MLLHMDLNTWLLHIESLTTVCLTWRHSANAQNCMHTIHTFWLLHIRVVAHVVAHWLEHLIVGHWVVEYCVFDLTKLSIKHTWSKTAHRAFDVCTFSDCCNAHLSSQCTPSFKFCCFWQHILFTWPLLKTEHFSVNSPHSIHAHFLMFTAGSCKLDCWAPTLQIWLFHTFWLLHAVLLIQRLKRLQLRCSKC